MPARPAEPSPGSSSVSPEEVARFGALAARWWDPRGPMAPLHAMNPVRTEWVARHVAGPRGTLLDIGCGAGLASEAFARLGFDTLGLDASAEGIDAARAHLAAHPLPPEAAPLSYRAGSAEELVAEGRRFDVVSALEVIEHVTDPAAFMALLARLAKPGGLVAVSTLNRTLRAAALAKYGAEYVLRLLPAGTHDWRKFIRPHELAAMGRAADLRTVDVAGMSFSPLPPPGAWRITRDTGINYIAAFRAPPKLTEPEAA